MKKLWLFVVILQLFVLLFCAIKIGIHKEEAESCFLNFNEYIEIVEVTNETLKMCQMQNEKCLKTTDKCIEVIEDCKETLEKNLWGQSEGNEI